MKKNILSDVNRVLEIMGVSNLTEQKTVNIGTTTVDGTINTFKKGKPIIIEMDKEATYDVNADDPKTVAGPFYNELLKKLKAVLGENLKTKNSGLKLVSAEISSGASNYYDKASTEADIKNDRVTSMPELKSGFAMNLGKEVSSYEGTNKAIHHLKGSQPYLDNKDLARRRGVKFLAHIKALLKNAGIDVLEPLKEEIINSQIIDTGGVIDKDRVEDTYPHPGQFITMKLKFMKESVAGQTTDILKCLVGLKIIVGFFKTGVSASQGKKNTGGHNCNSAIFNVYLNGVRIGIANLNNLSDPDIADTKKWRIINPNSSALVKKQQTKKGKDKTKQRMQKKVEKGTGKNVACQFEIDNKQAQNILAKTKKSSLTLSIKGMIEGGCINVEKPELKTCDGHPTYKGISIPDNKSRALHANVPFVRIRVPKYNDEGKRKGYKTIYSGEPDVDMKRGDTSRVKVLKMDVCKHTVNDSL